MDFIFDPPVWAVLVLAAGGIGTFIYGNARLMNGVRFGGVGVLLLAITWFAVAWFVDTHLEASVKRTRAIVASVNDSQFDVMESLMNSATGCLGFRGAKEIADGAKERASQFGLKNVWITGLNSSQAGNLIDIDIGVMSEQNMPPTMPTSWKFKYEVRADGVLLSSIEPTAIGNQNVDELKRRLQK
jgi:hypothetical protein